MLDGMMDGTTSTGTDTAIMTNSYCSRIGPKLCYTADGATRSYADFAVALLARTGSLC
jgi:hypothetical protein